jgi:hypothetical protein
MQNVLRVGMVLEALSLVACFGGETSDADGVVGMSEASLVAPRNPCDLMRCRDGFSCRVDAGKGVCAPVECKSDADCRLEADYCGGCNCRALAEGEEVPVCKGDVVACFVWPCTGHEARCVSGACALDGEALE